MAASARYFDLVREMKNAYNHRLRLVESARQRGIKPTARLFATTVPTVRKWLRRYQQQGPSGLLEVSRAPHRQPRKTPAPLEQQLVALRNSLPTFGARRLIREFDLPISHHALDRIWRAHGLLKKRRRKNQRRHQGFRRYPPLLDPGPALPLAGDSVHRPRCPQRTVVLVLRATPFFHPQCRLRCTHPAASGSLRRLAARCGLADRQRRRVQRRFSCGPRRQPARAHPAGRAHLPERCRNRASPRRRRVLRPRRFPKPRRFPCQGPHLSALLQPGATQLPQGKSKSLANHRAACSSLTPRTLLASTRLPGLPPQRLRGIRCP